MIREIKFRGKAKRDGEWFFGNLFDKDTIGKTHICTTKRGCLDIDPDTVGQFTGLKDKNGREIYEGDIVKCNGFIYQVCYECERIASFYIVSYSDMYRHYFGEAMEAEDCVVIGNIHDNPELLKMEEVTTLRRRGENG